MHGNDRWKYRIAVENVSNLQAESDRVALCVFEGLEKRVANEAHNGVLSGGMKEHSNRTNMNDAYRLEK